MKKSHFIDEIRSKFITLDKEFTCEVCERINSSNERIMLYLKDWEDAHNLYVCDECKNKLTTIKIP